MSWGYLLRFFGKHLCFADDILVERMSRSHAAVVVGIIWSHGDLGKVVLGNDDDNSDDNDEDNDDNSDDDDDDNSEYLGKEPNFHKRGNKRF